VTVYLLSRIDGGGARLILADDTDHDEDPPLRTPNFALDGPARPGETQVCTAVSAFLLARRRSVIADVGMRCLAAEPHCIKNADV